MELMQASRQWASRPSDERFVSLTELGAFCRFQRQHSARRVKSNRDLTVIPSASDDRDIAIQSNGNVASFTHWSFQQLASLAGVPAGYIRDSQMPGALAADNLNWGLHVRREVEDVSVLVRRKPDSTVELGAVNGPHYGVLWNSAIVDQLIAHFGDGVTSSFRVPGEFGARVPITKENTTLYASDRDIWVFLADEERRIEIPDRRNGTTGSLARGFFVSNSETGAGKARFGTFMFDYVCCNRIIWGAQDFDEIAIRHTKGAPHRWLEEVAPILTRLAHASPEPIRASIAAARAHKLGDKVADFLASRFGGKGIATSIMAIHTADEQRPIETLWDVTVGATAYARSIPWQNERATIERTAGELLKLASR